MSASFRAVSFYLRLVKKPALARMRTADDMRRGLRRAGEAAAALIPGGPAAGLRLSRETLGPARAGRPIHRWSAPLADDFADRGGLAPSLLRCRWVGRDGREDGDLAPDAPLTLFLHGGAFGAGSPKTHLSIARRLAQRLGGEVAALDYRLAPENPFPAALDDAVAAYMRLLDGGTPPSRLRLSGDSAGAGLAAALLVEIDRLGLPAPAAAALFSPFADLTLSGESVRRNARREALLPTDRIAEVVAAYVGGGDPADPRISPVFARFAAPPPPTLIQVGGSEALLDDSRGLAEAFGRAGGRVRFEITPHAPHGIQFFAALLPAARAMLDRAADFLADPNAEREPNPENAAAVSAA